jgi:hypothetical protein
MIIHLVVRYLLHYIKLYLDNLRVETLGTDLKVEQLAEKYRIMFEKEAKELREKQSAKISNLAELRSYLE